MEKFWQIVAGLIITFLLGLAVKPLVKKLKAGIELPPPRPNLKGEWDAITGPNESDKTKDKSGEILGRLERLLFFIAFWNESYVIIAGWLTFKVGSKWQVWSNVISVPKDLEGVDPLVYLRARRQWGSQRLMSFLVGTLSNALAAFGGFFLGKHGYETIRLLFC
ncbi:MAG: hypothetical protein ACREXX_10915 [Gammaproteobacteria bacterium]